ncbi:MAG: phosphoglycerate dehydrogenase [Mobilitalea sp.]
MKKIVSFFGTRNDVFNELNERAAKYALEKGLEYEWAPQSPFDKLDVINKLNNADAGIIDIEPYNDDIFTQVKESTRLLVRFGVGYDKVNLEAASVSGIAIARTPGANTLGVAEMALMLLLSTRRQLAENMACFKAGHWEERPVSNETIGGTVGIVGFGAIGRALARLLTGFDCRVIAYDPFPNKELAQQLGVELMELDELFEVADAISIHVPYMKETHHLVNARMLAKMKPTSVIVNTARGNIVDEDALYETLAAHKIRGAALDVFAEEPLPFTSPLYKLDNIILTPHVSSQTVESLWRIYEMAIDIAADFFAGNDSPYILNPDYKENIAK